MAKKSMVARDDKRAKLNKKFSAKRAELKAALKNKELDLQERLALTWKLDNLPVDSAKERQRNRCVLTGRPRGYYRKFGLSRIELRRLAGSGEIPGLIKSSW